MAENTIKFETPEKAKPSGSGSSIFSGLEKKLKLEAYFEEGFPVQYLPRIVFFFALALIYISNTHYADKATREANRLQSEVEDLRADYTTLKADVMYASKQSEVARRVRPLGLEESMVPPFKVVIDKSEY
jgi:hypothetical protein